MIYRQPVKAQDRDSVQRRALALWDDCVRPVTTSDWLFHYGDTLSWPPGFHHLRDHVLLAFENRLVSIEYNETVCALELYCRVMTAKVEPRAMLNWTWCYSYHSNNSMTATYHVLMRGDTGCVLDAIAELPIPDAWLRARIDPDSHWYES